MCSGQQRPTSIFSKETNHEKSTHRNLDRSLNHHGLGKLHNAHILCEWQDHHVYRLLLWLQLHNHLYLRTP